MLLGASPSRGIRMRLRLGAQPPEGRESAGDPGLMTPPPPVTVGPDRAVQGGRPSGTLLQSVPA